jgi:hypothetical protein
MAIEFSAKVPPIPIVQSDAARQVINQIARDYMQMAVFYLAGCVAEEAPRNFGNLAQSFQASPATPGGGVEVLGTMLNDGAELYGRTFSTLPQAVVMEHGRRAGAPISRAGMAALALWVRRKLGLSGREAVSATYAVATAIIRRGLAARHYAEKGADRAKPRIQTMFVEMSQAIAAGLVGNGGKR